MRAFKNPGALLGDLDGTAVDQIIMAAADIALILDGDGVIQDLSISHPDLKTALDECRDWVGQPWRDKVTVESRQKVDGLLADVAHGAPPRWRHLNHPAADGLDVPILYSALKLGAHGLKIAVGRDLRGFANLQQRLVDAQQSMDQDYVRLQHLELRYRLLFQTSREAILIVDTATYRVLEANPAAMRLLGEAAKRSVGRALAEVVSASSWAGVADSLSAVRASGRPDEVRVKLADGEAELVLAAHVFRQDQQTLYLIRLFDPDASAATSSAGDRPDLRSVMEHLPDAFIVTRADGRILYANSAFLDLAQLSTHEQAQGESFDRWLGQPGVDVGVLIANLKQRGSIRLFATTMRGEHGIKSDVEVSAVAVTAARQPIYGFAVRNVARRWAAEPAGPKVLPRTPEQLTELIGRVPLKDLVRETTDVIERLCIEAALDLTGNNRASAAEMLGLSRQSLYVKLRRFGIDDAEETGDV